MQNLSIGFVLTKDEVPEIRMMIVVNGQIVQAKVVTAEIMTIAAQKVFAQEGKCHGRMLNSDGTVGDMVSFKASKVEVY